MTRDPLLRLGSARDEEIVASAKHAGLVQGFASRSFPEAL